MGIIKRVPFALPLATVVLAACGGGSGNGLPSAALSTSSQWAATLRNRPTVISLSLSAPAMQFAYVDSAPIDGVVPSANAFLQDFQTANPGLITGPCALISAISAALISPSTISGAQTPTVVVSAYPKSLGTCTQALNLGTAGTQSFTVTVNP